MLETAILIVVAASPISLLTVKIINKIFSKYNENSAGTTAICTGINNILTKDYLIVKSIFFDKYRVAIKDNKEMLQIENINSKEKLEIDKTQLIKEEGVQLIATISHLCRYEKVTKIESIISNFFLNTIVNKREIEKSYEIISKIPSNEEKKLSTIVAKKINTNEVFALTKGHPLKVLEKCSRILINGKKIELNNLEKRKIKKNIEKLNQKGQKVIAFAYKGLPIKILDKYSEEFTENDLIFIGYIGIANPINRETIKSIKNAKKKGIKIFILSHMKERNAVAIGKELKIINENYYEAITGEYLDNLNDQKLKKLLSIKEKDIIFAKLNKNHKSRIIKTLKEIGEKVAVISTKQGKTIKEILERIEKAEIIKKNKEKIIWHAISCKIAILSTVILSLILKAPLPISITLILIIDIIVNSSIELAIREESYIKTDTKFKKKTIIGYGILWSIILIGIYLLTLNRFGWSLGDSINTSKLIQKNIFTTVFASIIIIQIISSFHKTNMLRNIFLLFTAIINGALLYIFTNTKQLNDYLQLSFPTKIDWQIIGLISIGIIMIMKLPKIIRKNGE